MRLVFAYLSVFIIQANIAQTLNSLKLEYPKDDVVTLALTRHLDITESRGKLNITETFTKKDFYLTSNRLSYANESIDYDSFESIEQVNAYTSSIANGKTTKQFVKEFEDKDVLIRGIFFNDRKKKSFSFPNVTKGSTTFLEYKKKIKDPHFLPSFVIGKSFPIKSVELSVSFPNTVKVAYSTFNLDSVDVDFKTSKTDKHTTYKWILRSVPKINRNYDFNPIYYLPQVFIRIESYNYKGKEKSVLSNPKDLYLWYNSLIKDINKTDQTELETLTHRLIKGLKSDEEKIKAIYYFIQNEINYIAFEDGLNGFIPRDAKNIYTNKYGDCKDMANILNEMLKYAGITSYLTWIGTRNRPFTYSELPTPMVDNHMITTVKLNDEYLFLDATAKYLGFGYPSPFIQGKEALIGISDSEYKIIKVPEIDPEKNVTTIHSNLQIEDKALLGYHEAEFTGFEKLNMLHKLQRKDDDDLDFLQSALKFGKKRTKISEIAYQNLKLINDTLQIAFNSKTYDYVKEIDNLIYLKPHLDYNLKSEVVKAEKKKFDKKIEHKFQKNFITTIKIPENLKINSLPKDVTFENPQFNFKITYALSGQNTIVINKQIMVNTLKVSVVKMDKWNKFIKGLNKVSKHSIILEKQ
ncbi:DUF3857 domain-containing protein [Winogradskyella sp.]|uniref:DUF3857 domain-containing transglutaminase family protein n=1 Tax=Winogradskyella sp. TaxID=1883156 RepID=UPI00262E8396|nr:DUF3857 domain-containing protein [Winogradskyella sp.]